MVTSKSFSVAKVTLELQMSISLSCPLPKCGWDQLKTVLIQLFYLFKIKFNVILQRNINYRFKNKKIQIVKQLEYSMMVMDKQLQRYRER